MGSVSVGEDARSNDARWPLVVAAAATAASGVLGFWDLGAKSMWYDEGSTINLVDRGYGDFLWRLTHWEVNQSPYFVLLSGWQKLGSGDVFLRSLSVLFFIAAVPALFLLGRRLYGAPVGAVAAVLLALHPLVLQWSQQLRAYSLVVLLVIVASYLLVDAVEIPSTAHTLLYAVVASLAVYTHFFAALVVVAHAVALLLVRPLPRRLAAQAGATIAILVAPLGIFFVTRKGDPLYWVSSYTAKALVATTNGLTGGGTASVVGYGLALIIGAGAIASRVRRDGTGSATWSLALPVVWLVVPLVLVVLAHVTVKPLLEARFLIVIVPAMALVAAVGLCRLVGLPTSGESGLVTVPILTRAGAVILAAALVAGSISGDRTWYRAGSYEDWRGAVAAAVGGASPHDSIVVLPSRAVGLVRYYARQEAGPGPRIPLHPLESPPPRQGRVLLIERVGTGPEVEAVEAWLAHRLVLRREQRFKHVVVRTYLPT